jgi:hypothetical protein
MYARSMYLLKNGAMNGGEMKPTYETPSGIVPLALSAVKFLPGELELE